MSCSTDLYWQQYLTLFDSTADVITLLDSTSIVKAVQHSPVNVQTLITVLSNHLASLLALPHFPLPAAQTNPNRSHTTWPAPRQSTSRAPDTQRDLAKEALNCLRVLSRVVPLVMRPQSALADPLEEAIFWTTEKVRVESPSTHDEPDQHTTPNETSEDETGQFVIDDDEDEDEAVDRSTPSGQAKTAADSHHDTSRSSLSDTAWRDVPPLAERLLATLVDLAFVPGFTLPEQFKNDDGSSCVSYIIW